MGLEIGGPTNLGFGSWVDRAFDLRADSRLTNISHTNSTLTINFFANGGGWQGDSDELWGMENLQVGLNRVPEPAGILLLATGVAGIAGIRKKIKK